MATNDDWDRERALDRDFDREPTFGSRPRRIPLHERGAVRVHVEKRAITAETITDNEICDVADEVRRLVVTALGEDEGGGLPPSHPLVKKARRKLAAIAEILNARGGK